MVVLDFQSLYPSIMIAYNYCFSTCLGRVCSLGEGGGPFPLGASVLRVPEDRLLALLQRDQVTLSSFLGVPLPWGGLRLIASPTLGVFWGV